MSASIIYASQPSYNLYVFYSLILPSLISIQKIGNILNINTFCQVSVPEIFHILDPYGDMMTCQISCLHLRGSVQSILKF